MHLSTPDGKISNLARPRGRYIPETRTSFSKLSAGLVIPETTLRRQLTRLGVAIPKEGFFRSQGEDIRQLIHSQQCLSGWNLVAEFSSQEEQVKLAGRQAAIHRARFEKLLTKITRK
jgi:hypothetical protein